MTVAYPITSVYPVITDIDGQPLEGGYVWIGQPDLDPQTNPIQVYWDKELTIAAPQPIRTIGGYFARSGSPANVYAATDFSMRVMNKNGSVIYSAPKGSIAALEELAMTQLRAELAAKTVTGGPGLLGFGGELSYAPGTVGEKLKQTPSIPDFWRSGDGADYTPALQRAIDSGEPVITGLGREYTIGGSVTGRGNLKLTDAIFNVPGLSSNAYVIDFSGTEGAAQTLAVDHARAVWTLNVPNGAAFTVDGWAFLRSNEYWASPSRDNVKYGEMVRVAGISGNVLTLYWPTLLAYTTAQAATIVPINVLDGIVMEDVRAVGPVSTGNQGGFRFRRCANVDLRNVRTTEFDYTHLMFDQSARCHVWGGGGNKTGVQEGLDYGVVVSSGCYDVSVDGYRGDSMRHIVTIGGSQGISRNISATNCRGTNLTNAGLDSHSAVYEHTFASNFLHFSDFATTTTDGIAVQGAAPIISGNHIYNCKRHGIAWSPETLASFDGPVFGQFNGNIVNRPVDGGTSNSVACSVATPVSGAGYAPISSLIVDGLQASGADVLVQVEAVKSAINRISVSQVITDTPLRSRGVYVYANESDINGVSINCANLNIGVTTNPAIALFANPGFTLSNWSVSQCHMKRNGVNGSVGLSLTRTTNGQESCSTFENVLTSFSVDTESTGYKFGSDHLTPIAIKRQQVTIASNAITLTSVNVCDVRLETEGSDATDDLSTINGGVTIGQTITLYSSVSARDVTVKDGVGNIRLSGDRLLSHPDDRLMLRFDGANWFEIAFADSAA